MKTDKPYGIGLDIGTNSVGFAATDEDGHLIRLKGKNVIGAYLFEAGISAAERRGYRTTRRRLARVKWRLRLLRHFFEPYINEVDAEFFLRQKYSNISKKDPNYSVAKGLFNDRSDKDFYEQYPTIYHLRNALMTEQRQFDVREIYLAVHHIVKNRGHFLKEGRAKDFKTSALDLKVAFETLNQAFETINPLWDLVLPTDDEQTHQLAVLMLQKDGSQSDKSKEVIKLLMTSIGKTGDKQLDADRKRIISELSKALFGLKTKLWVLANEPQNSDWEIKLENYGDFEETIGSGLSDELQTLFNQLNDVYGVITLSGIVPTGESFSQGMIDQYNQHAHDLELLKRYCAEQTDRKRGHEIRQTYDEYIAGDVKGKQVTQDLFYKALSKFADKDTDSKNAQQIRAEIAANEFMPKLRTKANGVVPHQLHQQELDAIINNQKQYYPWLAEINPVEKDRGGMPYKLDELVSFRIPYYVGPLVAPAGNVGDDEQKFAWMVRKENGEITPWNFDQKVDRQASAAAFIQRMKTTDSLLIGEDVLPEQSLLYQKFEVLNELNKIQIDGHPITVPQKQRLFNQLFMKKKGVTVKDVKGNLEAHNEELVDPAITGLSDPDKFNSSYGTYYDYSRILGDAIDDLSKRKDVEQIIAWSTIFEDTAIFRQKLTEIVWLTDDERSKLSHIRYRGWGRHSKTLLDGIMDGQNRTIIQRMWETNENFMQIQADPDIAKRMGDINGAAMAAKDTDDLIDGFYTSPENKKAIREVMKVVKDIQRAHHDQAPKWIYIESPRDQSRGSGRRTVSRGNQLEAQFTVAHEIIDANVADELAEAIKNKVDFSDRLVLYFQQNGRDMYTGNRLSLDDLSKYDIDHILPQSLIKDDSLDNRVLVESYWNRVKNNQFASELFMEKMGHFWHLWHKQGLISSRKLRHLLMRPDEVDKYATGFVARQLTETRQVIRLTGALLSDVYDDTTKIVMIKAGLNHDFRRQFDFPKNRDANDYHHAFDALLTAKIGRYLLMRYPTLEPFFVYGDYLKGREFAKKITKFNFITQMKQRQIDKKTGEIIWDDKIELSELDHIYNYKKMLITRESFQNHTAMFKQTLYGTEEDNNKSLIPAKIERPTAIYGGYTQKTSAYMCIVWLEREQRYRIMGVNTLDADEIASKSVSDRDSLLHDIVFKTLNNESKRGIKENEFRVVVPQVLMEQLIQDDGNVFALGSAGYYRNVQQLFVSRSDQMVLNNVEEHDDEKLVNIFKKAIEQVNARFGIYDVNGLRKDFNSSLEAFTKLPLTGEKEQLNKQEALRRVFIGLHANAARTDLKQIGIKSELGKLSRNKIVLSAEAKLIYKSPTGLFTRTVPLSSL